jgi:hypothetical protein
VTGGVVYVHSTDGFLYAYKVGCGSGGAHCNPLWIAGIGDTSGSTTAVASGLVYAGSDNGFLYALPTSCPTAGGGCNPAWTANTGGPIFGAAVAGNVVFAASGSFGSGTGKLSAYPASCGTGGANCSPTWTATIQSRAYGPAVADGIVYVATDGRDANGHARLYAFISSCGSGGATCTPLWTADIGPASGGSDASPVVANGVVYVTQGGVLRAFAVTCGIGGATCNPIWTHSGTITPPAIANGMLYVQGQSASTGQATLTAYALP